MNYFEFERMDNAPSKVTMDDTLGEAAAKVAREGVPPAPHGMNSSAKVIAEFSNKNRILSAEEITEHRKHCRAMPGNCPFEKAKDEADDISPKDINITKQAVFNRFAALLTQMFNMSKNLAKPAIADQEKVEELSGHKETTTHDHSDKKESTAQDESPDLDTNPDAKLVAEIIESGIQKMVDMAKNNGCAVDMDAKKSRYIVSGPPKDQSKD